MSVLITLTQILSAGISITAFSLWLYALTFNLRERVARAFAVLLVLITGVYFGDTVISTLADPGQAEVWLRLQWIAIGFIPVAYLHFSDALLATTGQPSRGRRRLAIRLVYVVAAGLVVLAVATNWLITPPVTLSPAGVITLEAGPVFGVFAAYFVLSVGAAWWNFARAYRRCITSTARRRMAYLMISAAAPLLGAFPFLLVLGPAADQNPLVFWSLALAFNVVVSALLVVMAYTVAYFGVSQPDRVIKARLFQWLLRGPVVASTTLAVYVLVGRYGPLIPLYDPRLLPFLLIAVLLLLQFAITLVRLPAERRLFYGADRDELQLLQMLETRIISTRDLRQFLELVLVSLCDTLRRPAAFVVAFDAHGKVDEQMSVGDDDLFAAATPVSLPALSALRRVTWADREGYAWGDYWLWPVRPNPNSEPLGLLGLKQPAAGAEPLTEEQQRLAHTLFERLTTALEDRRLQHEVFAALNQILPHIETVQRLRASANYAGGAAPALAAGPASDWDDAELAHMVREALSHYWGGPKLTQSPLLRLRVVEQALAEHDGNAANALRAVLQTAIERLKPDPAGPRKFTSDWLLYNILEMKFLQNRKVREVAMRLAVSEAELYRKQRVALEEVAAAILEMERQVPSAPASNGQ